MKGVLLHAALALGGLTAAYLTWTQPPGVPAGDGDDSVVLFECEPGQLSRFSVETARREVSFERERDAAGIAHWVTARRKPREVADAGAPAAAADAGVIVTDAPQSPQAPRERDPDAPVTFLADAGKFASALERLTPLRALRSLGTVADASEEYGFEQEPSLLKLECGEQRLELEIGGQTYGRGHRYARDARRGEVYLIDGRIFADLSSARFKFFQSRPHGFGLSDVDEVRVSALGTERQLLHRNRKQPKRSRWVDARDPERRNAVFDNFWKRFERLRVKSYLDPGDGPGSDLQLAHGQPQPVARFEYRADGEPLGELEIVRVQASERDEAFYYARSETTRRWATLYDAVARQLEQDLPLLLGAESSEPEKQPEPEKADD
jgi:hypothetical protein